MTLSPLKGPTFLYPIGDLVSIYEFGGTLTFRPQQFAWKKD
jgi:hypothetical protein